MEDVKLYISVASCRDWKPQFGASITGLFYHLFQNGLNGRLKAIDFKAAMQASCLSGAREIALREATERGFTHWLSLDDDMSFPMDIVERLLAHDKTVVAANYRRKDISKNVGVACYEGAVPVDSSEKHGLEEVAFSAFGLSLIKIQEIKHIAEPHFEVVWNPATRTYWTEDMVFSAKLRTNGIKLWVDHDLSHDIQHIGDYAHQFPALPEQLKEAA